MTTSEPIDQKYDAAAPMGASLLAAGVVLVVAGLVFLVAPGPGLLFLVPGVVLAVAGLAMRLLARKASRDL